MSETAKDVTYTAKTIPMKDTPPTVGKDQKMFDATMSNTGLKAQGFAKKLTKGLSPEFPVK